MRMKPRTVPQFHPPNVRLHFTPGIIILLVQNMISHDKPNRVVEEVKFLDRIKLHAIFLQCKGHLDIFLEN